MTKLGQPEIVLLESIEIELVDYGDDPTARARVRQRYMYEVGSEGGRWYREDSRGDEPTTGGDVALIFGPPLRAAAEGAAKALLSAACPGVTP